MKLLSTLTLSASVTSILLQRDNSLLAAVCDDLVVRVVDIETKRVVRELAGARGQILDLVSKSSRSVSSFVSSGPDLVSLCRLSPPTRDGSSPLLKTRSSELSMFRPETWSTLSGARASRRVCHFRLLAISSQRHMSIVSVSTYG